MTRKLVIPADATAEDEAWGGLTWQDIADQNGVDGIEPLGSAWCVDNAVNGLGIVATVPPPPPPPPDSIPPLELRVAAAAEVLHEADALGAPALVSDLQDIIDRAAEALTGGQG